MSAWGLDHPIPLLPAGGAAQDGSGVTGHLLLGTLIEEASGGVKVPGEKGEALVRILLGGRGHRLAGLREQLSSWCGSHESNQ